MEGEKRSVRPEEVHVEVHNSREGKDPATVFCVRSGIFPSTPDDKNFGVASGGGGGIRKRRFPCDQVLWIEELDVGEEVLSGTRDP